MKEYAFYLSAGHDTELRNCLKIVKANSYGVAVMKAQEAFINDRLYADKIKKICQRKGIKYSEFIPFYTLVEIDWHEDGSFSVILP